MKLFRGGYQPEKITEKLNLPSDYIPHSLMDNSQPTQDLVNHPAHYTRGKVETIDGLESAVEGLQGKEAGLTWQVIKYMWRWKFKGQPLQDLRKAEFFLKRLIKYVEVEG